MFDLCNNLLSWVMVLHFMGKEQGLKGYSDLPKVLLLQSSKVESRIWFSGFQVKNPLYRGTGVHSM